MGWHDKVRTLRYVQTLLQVVPTFLQIFCLGHEQIGCKHHAIADNVCFSALEYARRNAPQDELLTVKL